MNKDTEVKTEDTEVKQKNPHLFCLITGKSRPTTWAYLKDKAERLGTDVDGLINNYVSREAITALLDGRSLEEIRSCHKNTPTTDISNVRLAELIRLNSKAKKAAEKFNVVATTTVDVNEDSNINEEVNIEAEPVMVEKPKRSRKKKQMVEEVTEMVTEESVSE